MSAPMSQLVTWWVPLPLLCYWFNKKKLLCTFFSERTIHLSSRQNAFGMECLPILPSLLRAESRRRALGQTCSTHRHHKVFFQRPRLARMFSDRP